MDSDYHNVARTKAIRSSLRGNSGISNLIMDFTAGLEYWDNMQEELLGTFVQSDFRLQAIFEKHPSGLIMNVYGITHNAHIVQEWFKISSADHVKNTIVTSAGEIIRISDDFDSFEFRNTHYYKAYV